MPLTYAQMRAQKQRQALQAEREREKERRPRLTTQEERFLYSLHLKTIEHRTLMETLRKTLTPSEFNQLIVEYTLRLRKAKNNFEKNNWKDEWDA